MVQWIPPDNEARYRLMLRSFVSVFPHVSVWQAGGIVIGSNDPIRLDRRAFEEKLTHPAVEGVFRLVGFQTFDALRAAYVGGRREAVEYAGDGPLLRDDRPVIEYFLSMPRGGPAVEPLISVGSAATFVISSGRARRGREIGDRLRRRA
jgi:hypothetical protein